MPQHRIRLLVLALVVCSAGATTGANSAAPENVACDVRATFAKLSGKALDWQDALKQAFIVPKGLCVSVMSVLDQLANDKVPSGRKLEKDKPFNPNTAAAEYAAIQAQTEFSTELAALLARETDPLRRKLVEAALLHDFGKFEARNLVLRQLLSE